MASIEQKPIYPPGVREPEYLREQRLKREADERKNAFSNPKAQEYWSLGPEELTLRWQKTVDDIIKNISGGDIDVPPIIVSPCSFSKEELSGFRNKEVTLFVPKRQGRDWIAKLDQKIPEQKLEKAINGYSIEDKGPSGIWIAMEAKVDPPYLEKDKAGIEAVIEKNNFRTGEGKRKENLQVLKLMGVGIEAYSWFAKLVKEITGVTVDNAGDGISVSKQHSRLLICKVGGREAAAVRFGENGLEILWGLADSCSSPYVGWRLARVSGNLTKG